MIRQLTIAALLVASLACAGSDAVEIHRPLGGFPNEPSTVLGRVQNIDENAGLMVVSVSTVDGVARRVIGFIYIDENTVFTNSGGGKNVRSWEELTGADIVIKGWYRGEEYFADEVDVISFPVAPLPTPRRSSGRT